MEYAKLGDSLEFSRISQGFWRVMDWKFTDSQLAEFMEACISRGVTTFDTAQIYANTECERKMGLAFKQSFGLREKVKIVSKTGIFTRKSEDGVVGYYNTTYKSVLESCKQSIKRLNCDYLDLYLIHREDPCFDPWETARAFKELKASGLILEAGVSNFDSFKYEALNTAMDGTLVTNQIECNPTCFEHFNSGMMDYLCKNKIQPMIWSPLAGGQIFTSQEAKYQNVNKKLTEIAKRHEVEPDTIAYAWLLYHPVHAIPINGSNKLSRLDNAIKALDVKLEHWEWYELYTASGQQILR